MQLTPLAEVHVEENFLHSPLCLELLSSYPLRIALVTDTNVRASVADKWVQFLTSHGMSVTLFCLPAGEEGKTRAAKEELEDALMRQGFGRKTLLIAMGGGVVTDLGGFLASTFMRGVPLLLIPTTLLGMVDAAIGGKTGVNTPFGKNTIGSYYLPEHIIVDPATLSTLPAKEWKNGMAEVIKYALISSPELFHTLLNGKEAWDERDEAFLSEIIHASMAVKSRIVSADYREGGYRRILNFGHTIAHGVERAMHYRCSHGEAVALGLSIETHLSARAGFLPHDALDEILHLLTLYDFPHHFPSHISFEHLSLCMQSDKKGKEGSPRFVLLEEIGKVVPFDGAYCHKIDEQLLKQVCREIGGMQ